MTTIPTNEDRASIRLDEDVKKPEPVKAAASPGPMAIFVVLVAVTVGLGAALAFLSLSPDTAFVILGGTLVSAGILGFVGLYRYQWFLLICLLYTSDAADE